MSILYTVTVPIRVQYTEFEEADTVGDQRFAVPGTHCRRRPWIHGVHRAAVDVAVIRYEGKYLLTRMRGFVVEDDRDGVVLLL